MVKKKRKWIVFALIAAVVISAVLFVLYKRGMTDIVIDEAIPRLEISSSAFTDGGVIPDKYTGNGEDVSPDFQLSKLSEDAVSIAVIMDDLDVPWASNYTHWVIWNIPPQDIIPEAIPHGELVDSLDGAIQGVAYGRNRYRGPQPPFGTHRYQYHVFVLDAMLELDGTVEKGELLAAMEDHILQYGSLTAWYPRAAG